MNKNRISPNVVYRILFKSYGPQGWWPTTKNGYKPANKNRLPKPKEQFEIALGAILTQNTAWTNVEKALTNLSKAGYLNPIAWKKSKEKKIAQLIRPSGYFNQKARRIKGFVEYISTEHKGTFNSLWRKPVQKARETLLGLDGIGPETADSMLLYAGNKPIFVVDAYTRRIGKRLGWYRTDDYEKVQDYFHKNLQKSAPLFNEFHALFVNHAKIYCRVTPRCEDCPLNRWCTFSKN